MKFAISFFAIYAFGVLINSVSAQDQNAVFTRYENNNIGVDGYNFAYETSNDIAANEQGTLKNAGTANEALSVVGQYSYVGDDNINYRITYTADESGFQPRGDHLPEPPQAPF